MRKKTIWELMAEISEQMKDMEALRNMSTFDYLAYINQPKDEPTIRELTLSEMIGAPIKIIKK